MDEVVLSPQTEATSGLLVAVHVADLKLDSFLVGKMPSVSDRDTRILGGDTVDTEIP
jgi:hypothetical protein